ncbi:MAG: transposase [Cyclobacteriaceae bacterium]
MESYRHLIDCTDNLTGFRRPYFPKAGIQLCVIHLIRSSLKYVGSKEPKIFMKDLKLVYQANTKDKAKTAQLDLEENGERNIR